MKKNSFSSFVQKITEKKDHYPWNGQIELTYRCQLKCVHCYCAHDNNQSELAAGEWKKVLNEIHKEGCLYLTLTGGDPLVRDDFLELYSYAKEKGFIITLFTNGQSFNKKILNYLKKSPPLAIEITLNGITKKTYESITGVEGSFEKTIAVIKELKKRNIKLILKSNCLKENKNEIGRIKAWTEEMLGKPSDRKYRFKYDPMIYPRLDGDISPCKHRLSFNELAEIKKQDTDIWKEYQNSLHGKIFRFERDKSFLYQCNAWMTNFYINPYGRLKFCMLTDKFSVDLKRVSFKEGFYNVFPRLLNETVKTDSKCEDCELKEICYHCPARAFLETGDEEAPVPYYCELAKGFMNERLKDENKSSFDQ
jgi:radical SAM protein with 4Fe4S-binding SPASM domain